VIGGGSRTYVEAMTRNFRQQICLGSPVHSVRRYTDGVEVSSGRGRVERFDHVIFACHSDQALRMIADPTQVEMELLAAFPYEPNVAILHTDASVLPRRRQAWAAWNYHIGGNDSGKATVTYNMNILQGLQSKHVFCVTLNGEDRIDPKCIIRRILYHHPVYTTRRADAQRRHGELIGVNRSSFCGAYWGNGFHEDGVNSAMAVCHQLSQRGAGSACTAESMKDAFDIGASHRFAMISSIGSS
jgi:predicted NAD/FAD-binding protein